MHVVLVLFQALTVRIPSRFFNCRWCLYVAHVLLSDDAVGLALAYVRGAASRYERQKLRRGVRGSCLSVWVGPPRSELSKRCGIVSATAPVQVVSLCRCCLISAAGSCSGRATVNDPERRVVGTYGVMFLQRSARGAEVTGSSFAANQIPPTSAHATPPRHPARAGNPPAAAPTRAPVAPVLGMTSTISPPLSRPPSAPVRHHHPEATRDPPS